MSVLHTIPPVYDAASRVLILGSFPSVKSRQVQFFYGHPQNRFWKVLPEVLSEPVPHSIPEKRALLLKRHIALWDVIGACDIMGSSDAHITNAQPNDISPILDAAHIAAVYTNGKKAHALYQRLILPAVGIQDVCLPSTSPANAAWSEQRLTESWSCIKTYL